MSDSYNEIAMERYPLRTTTISPLNHKRLPPPETYRDMELAFRPQADTSDNTPRELHLRWLRFAITWPATTALLFWFASLAPHLIDKASSIEGLPLVLGVLLGLAAVAILIAIAFLLPRAEQLTLAALLLPVGIAVVIRTLWHSPNVFLMRGVLVSLSVWLWPFTRVFFLRPYSGWLLADHRLTAAQRKTELLPNSRFDLIHVSLLLVAIIGAGKSYVMLPALALLCMRLPSIEAIRESVRFLDVFCTPDDSQPAPGLWQPSPSLLIRLPALVSILSLTYVAATAALYPTIGPVSVVLSPLLGNALVISLARSILNALAPMRALTEQLARKNPERSWWDCNVERLRTSQHVTQNPDPNDKKKVIREAEHLFVGYEPSLQIPILLSQDLLSEHCYMVGRTGSGKTSIGVAQMLIQLIRGHRTDTDWSAPSPIVILDLKGDELLFHTAREEAKRRGQEFRFFTLDAGKASYRFNPFRGFDSSVRSLPQLVQLILDSLSLNHGPGYGKSYYSQQSRFMLSQALERSGKPSSFNDLYKTLERMRREDPRNYKDAFELLSTIEVLTHYWQLLTSKDQEVRSPTELIQMAEVLEDRQVVYFFLRAALESISVREVAKLALFNLHSALLDRIAQSAEPRQTYLFIDEFQKAAGENFQTIIQQGRSAGMSVILANQSLADLKGDIDLRPTIQTNTGTKMYFSVTDPEEIKTLSFLSGLVLQSVGSEGPETLGPALGVNEILSISAERRQFLLQVAAGSGYTQYVPRPIAVETVWPFSAEEAARRNDKTPWPDEPMPPKSAPPKEVAKAPQQIEIEVKSRRKVEFSKAIKEME